MYNSNLHFHFVGIAGSGMSGLAEVLLGLGFKVSGSDIKGGEITTRLASLGAEIKLGHDALNLPTKASLLVYSSAVHQDNPEIVEAHKREIPVISRAMVLAELMRLKYGVAVAGSHGKTTTTSISAAILEAGGLDPTVIIGGRVKTKGSGARIGKGSCLVAESDESDRSFLLLKPTIAVVTNIDSEHLSAYASMAELEESFEKFVSSVPFYGLSILCIDDPRVKALAERISGRVVTYGLNPDADIRAIDIEPGRGTTDYTVFRKREKLFDVSLPMWGSHIAVNSLAAIAVGLEFGVNPILIRSALNGFPGVGRRLEVISEVGGITLMSDYGHHPSEIRATLSAIRAGSRGGEGRLITIFQPHRYSRTQQLFAQFLESFSAADILVTTDIYSAGESPIDDVNGESLNSAIDHPNKFYAASLEEAELLAFSQVRPGDTLLCLGAGSIGSSPERLLEMIRKNFDDRPTLLPDELVA
jgi:UDP-N-acetylmuramate--alanine ligase